MADGTSANPIYQIINAVSGGVDALSNLGGFITNAVISAKNNRLQRESFQFNKQMATEQWQWQKQQADLTRQREDNAIQRRVLDMQMAGLNPVLSAGNGASASAVSASAPQVTAPTLSKVEKLQSMLAISQAVQQSKQLEAQIELTKQEAKSRKLDNDIKPVVLAKELINTENAKKDGAYKDLQNISLSLDNQYKDWDYQKSYDTGISKDTHPLVKGIRDTVKVINNNADLLNNNIKNGANKVRQGFNNFKEKYSGNYGYQPTVYDVKNYQRH